MASSSADRDTLEAQISRTRAEIDAAGAELDAAKATGDTDLVKLYLADIIELRKKENLLLQPGEHDSVAMAASSVEY